jgi:UDP-glucose 6-dehydrogenase
LNEAEKLIQSLACKSDFVSVYVGALNAVSLAEQKDKRVRVDKDFRLLEHLKHQRTSILHADLFQRFLTFPENTSKEPVA